MSAAAAIPASERATNRVYLFMVFAHRAGGSESLELRWPNLQPRCKLSSCGCLNLISMAAATYVGYAVSESGLEEPYKRFCTGTVSAERRVPLIFVRRVAHFRVLGIVAPRSLEYALRAQRRPCFRKHAGCRQRYYEDRAAHDWCIQPSCIAKCSKGSLDFLVGRYAATISIVDCPQFVRRGTV
jgi:hypothetical protein